MALNLNLRFVFYQRLSPYFFANVEVPDKFGTTKVYRSALDYIFGRAAGSVDYSRVPVQQIPYEFGRLGRQIDASTWRQYISAWFNKYNVDDVLAQTANLPLSLWTGIAPFDQAYVEFLTSRRSTLPPVDPQTCTEILGRSVASRKFVESRIAAIVADTINQNLQISQPNDQLWLSTISFWLHPNARQAQVDAIDAQNVFFTNGRAVANTPAIWTNFLISETRLFSRSAPFSATLENLVARLGQLFEMLKIGPTEIEQVEVFKLAVKILTLRDANVIDEEIDSQNEYDLWTKFAAANALPHLVQWFCPTTNQK